MKWMIKTLREAILGYNMKISSWLSYLSIILTQYDTYFSEEIQTWQPSYKKMVVHQ